jgi:hypothetical protein
MRLAATRAARSGPPAGLPLRSAAVGVQFHQRLADELHAPVGARQSVQDGAVKHKHAMHLRQLRSAWYRAALSSTRRSRRNHTRPVANSFSWVPLKLDMSRDSAPHQPDESFPDRHARAGGCGFCQSVVYVCEHSERGALGLVINKPSDINLKGLFDKVELPLRARI